LETNVEVRCQTFVQDVDALPSDELELSITDPEEQERLYREAGLTRLANSIGPIQKAVVAERRYEALSGDDSRLYRSYLSRVIQPQDCTIPPPNTAVTVLIAARRSNLFSDIIVLSHPETGESLLLGAITSDIGTRYFKIAQWGEKLTSIEELRKQQRFSRAVGRVLKQVSEWRPQWQFNLPQPKLNDTVRYGLMTLVAAALCWGLFLILGWWWVFAPALVVAMTVCYGHTEDKTHGGDTARVIVGWIVAANLIAGLPVLGPIHLNNWMTGDHTEDVLVCSTYSLAPEDTHNPDGPRDWRINTDHGTLTLDPGYYDGVYFEHSSEKAANSLLGNVVRVTYHGHLSGRAPFVTEAHTLREGNCSR
jgi:hypothetical protein